MLLDRLQGRDRGGVASDSAKARHKTQQKPLPPSDALTYAVVGGYCRLKDKILLALGPGNSIYPSAFLFQRTGGAFVVGKDPCVVTPGIGAIDNVVKPLVGPVFRGASTRSISRARREPLRRSRRESALCQANNTVYERPSSRNLRHMWHVPQDVLPKHFWGYMNFAGSLC